MTELYEFDCGCKVPLLSKDPPKLNLYIYDVPLTCEKTWELIRTGNTKMGFQIESNLISHHAKLLKPNNIEDLSALISIVRPGVSQVRSADGTPLPIHFCKRKNGEEPVTYLHDCLKPYLESTYGILVYQEDLLKISWDIAGLDLVQADYLRKSVGKKDAQLLAKCRSIFIEGCARVGILPNDKANEFFDIVEKSARYLFNKAHGVGYAKQAYYSIWPKAHNIRSSFGSWLRFSTFEPKPKEEIRDLINHSVTQKVTVTGPDFRDVRRHFYIKGKDVKFGLADIKGVGGSVFNLLTTLIPTIEVKIGKTVHEWSFYEFIVHLGPKVNKTSMEAIICSGAVDYFKLPRSEMLDYYKKYKEFTKADLKYIEENYHLYGDIKGLLNGMARPKKEGGAAKNVLTLARLKGMVQRLENPAYKLEDTIGWLCDVEDELLGVAMSTSRVGELPEDLDITSCSDFRRIERRTYILAVEVLTRHVIKCKRGQSIGQEMAFLRVKDNSGILDEVTVFPNLYTETRTLLTEGNTIIIFGYKDGERKSMVAQKISQL